jgi:hypothetical protein
VYLCRNKGKNEERVFRRFYSNDTCGRNGTQFFFPLKEQH